MFGDVIEAQSDEPAVIVQGRLVDCFCVTCARLRDENKEGLRQSGRGGRSFGGGHAGSPSGKVKQRRFELPPERRGSPIADFFQSNLAVPTIGFPLRSVGSK